MTTPISRRTFVSAGAGALASVHVVRQPDTLAEQSQSALVVDASVPMAAPARGFDAFAGEVRARRAAGCDILFVPVAGGDDLPATLRNVLALQSYIARIGEEASLITRASEPQGTRRRIGIAGSFHGLQMLGEELDLIPQFRQAGIVTMQLTGCWKNANADGCFERSNNGLTGLGRMVVQKMTASGVILDIAQTGVRSSLEAIEVAGRPVIASRANAAGIHGHPQNLTGDQIKAIRDSKGVICLTAFPSLLSAQPRPSIGDFFRHLHYLVEQAGIDHIACGLDYDDRPRRRYRTDPVPDPPYAFPAGLSSGADLPNLRARLRSDGFAPAEIEQMLGRNLQRILDPILRAVAG